VAAATGSAAAGLCRARVHGPLLVELDAQPRELSLDLPDRLLALVELLTLRLRQRKLLDRLALALLRRRDGLVELGRALGDGGPAGAAAALPAGYVEAHLLELLLAGGDVLSVLAEGSLHLLDLRQGVLVAAPHVRPVDHRGKCGFDPGWWQLTTARRDGRRPAGAGLLPV
jgi:hypothetical protein